MKKLLLYFLILLAAVWLGLKIQANPGYVLISYKQVSVESTLWVAALTTLIAFFTFYLVLRLIYNSKILPARLQKWWQGRKEEEAVKLTNRGITKVIVGEFMLAEKYLTKGAESYANPFPNYLLAAYAAQKQENYKRREQYLTKAYYAGEKADFAIGLLQAEMQVASQQWEQALASLTHLKSKNSQHKRLLELLCTVYQNTQDWLKLCDLLPIITKLKIFDVDELHKLEINIYLHLAPNEAEQASLSWEKFWRKLPRPLQTSSQLVTRYVSFLTNHNLEAKAEAIIRESLKNNWQEELLNLYAKIATEASTKQLSFAEAWLKTHPNDAVLLLCLGKLCKKLMLWGKAKKYLLASLQIKMTAATYFELGEIMSMQNDLQAANDYYRQGLLKSFA